MSALIGGGMWITQGGLHIPDPIPPFYWVGVGMMVLGVIVVIIGWVRNPPKLETEQELNAIVPMLEKMDSLLREQAKKEAQKPYDKEKYAQLNTRINTEVFGMTLKAVKTPEMARREVQRAQTKFIRDYGNKGKDEWLQKADMLSGVFDSSGFGLKQYRDIGQYKKLMRTLTTNRNRVIDTELNKQIREHIAASETLNNMLLAKERSVNMKADYQNNKYAITDFIHLTLVSGLNKFEGEARERMITARTNIGKLIKELEAK